MAGMIENRAGPRKVAKLLSTKTAMKTNMGDNCPPVAITAATSPTTTAARMLVTTMMCWRFPRSVTMPASGPKTTEDRCHTAWTMAVCNAEPLWE